MIPIRHSISVVLSLGLLGTFTFWSGGIDARASVPAKAYFAGGCFWCMEEAFEQVEGVSTVVSGYMGGTVANPRYEQVSGGSTGHAESVEVSYDPAKVSYQKLLDVFWRNVDPITPNAQFCDHGNQYRSAVFYATDEEQRLSEESKTAIATMAINTGPRCFMRRTKNSGCRRSRKQRLNGLNDFPPRSPHKWSKRPCSIRLRTTIRTTTRRILSGINCTNTIAAGPSDWNRCGANPNRPFLSGYAAHRSAPRHDKAGKKWPRCPSHVLILKRRNSAMC